MSSKLEPEQTIRNSYAYHTYMYRLLQSFKFRAVNNPLAPYLTDVIMRLTTVDTDHVFNQGYHVSFDGLLRQDWC